MQIAFFNINSFISNVANSTNPVGELSDLGYTYARSIGEYSSTKGLLIVFDHGTLTTAQQPLVDQANHAVAAILDNVVNYNTSSGTLLANMIAALGVSASNVTIGPSVLNPVDNALYPEWIQFTTIQQSLSWDYKVWLVNDSFMADYPLGQFEFVFPLTNMQDLYYNFTACKTIIQSMDMGSLINKAAVQMAGIAVTGYGTLKVRVYNRLDESQYFDLSIAVAYNGGSIYNTQAAFLAALRDYLVNSGILTLQEWLIVIPGLVPVNKYYVIPNWGNAAVINLAVPNPICSPTIAVAPGDPIAAKYFGEYALTDVTNYLDYTVAIYKSLGLYMLPDATNLDGRVTFRNKFPDYYIVPLSDINIQQMSVATQNLVAMMDQLLRLSETYVDGQPLPIDTSILHRGAYTYLCRTVDTTQLCVLTRTTALAA